MINNRLVTKKNIIFFILSLILNVRGVLPTNSTDIIIVLLFMIMSSVFFSYRKTGLRNFDIIFMVFIILILFTTLLSGFYAIDYVRWILYSGYFIMGLLIFLILTFSIRSKIEFDLFLSIYLFVVAVIGFITIFSYSMFVLFQFRMVFVSYGETFRAVGLIGSPNYYAITLLLALGLMYYKIKSRKPKMIDFIAIMIYVIVLFMTISRGAIISLGVSTIIILILNFQYILKYSKIFFAVFISVFILYIISAGSHQILYDQIVLRFSNIGINNGSIRYILWEEGFNLLASSAKYFLMGVGGNQFIYYSSHNAHNSYLRSFFENGIIGFIVIALFLTWILNLNLRKTKLIDSKLLYLILLFLIFAISNDLFLVKEFWVGISLILIEPSISKSNLLSVPKPFSDRV